MPWPDPHPDKSKASIFEKEFWSFPDKDKRLLRAAIGAAGIVIMFTILVYTWDSSPSFTVPVPEATYQAKATAVKRAIESTTPNPNAMDERVIKEGCLDYYGALKEYAEYRTLTIHEFRDEVSEVRQFVTGTRLEPYMRELLSATTRGDLRGMEQSSQAILRFCNPLFE